MKFRYAEILKEAEKGFEEAWVKSSKLVEGLKGVKRLVEYVPGKPHPLFEVIELFRKAYLRLGFEEVINPIIVEEDEVKKQYGPEALAILDRCYYLATLPRPDVGMSKEKVEALRKLGLKIDDEKLKRLQAVLHEYKKGAVDSDDLIERIADSLMVNDVEATKILNTVFPEFKQLKPQPTTLTLRSHMTTAWFLTLSSLQHRKPLPIKLFSVGLRFRREQQEDATHLRVHHSASCVVMDEEVRVEDGAKLAEAILRQFGFVKFKHKRKPVTAKYYAMGTEYEVYVEYQGEWLEVANFGLYSPIALARYGIEYPVLNLGIGVERVAMILLGYNDVRKLVYPQFYGEWRLSDEEIAAMIEVDERPRTKEGALLASCILEALERNKDLPSPCEVLAFKGKLWGHDVEAYVYEYDPGVKLVGPAAFNKIYVYKANVLGIPVEGMDDKPLIREVREKGVEVGISYAQAVALKVAARAEEEAARGGVVDFRVKIAKSPSDVNIAINDVARRYIHSVGGRIDVRGPVFIGVKVRIGKQREEI
ncbi:MAG: O-phosphoserine--tRNA ligase [Thermoprotei archaeon]|nr:MAG: O-phosphoserine--tRNA ligase [Thermoprotei archaeon]